jgi:hypothetical protein
MSLYTLPVSVSDLTQLQLGIEFFTNPAEATTEAGLIANPPNTVYSYAVQLLGNNISLSQVTMAVDSLMFGTTENVTELTKLSTQFLPAQVANAVANGLNPTVYAAETLGLALAGGRTGDTLSTSHFQPSFASLFGSLPVAQFVSEVASLTGINATAIQGFVQNWTNIYSANPSATFGLPLTLAAYGAAFGDAVGVALLNPTANGTTALLVSEEQNALIDNAEGLYNAGIPLISEPPHTPLQGEAVLISLPANVLGVIDWAAQYAADTYAELAAPVQVGSLEFIHTPSTFTLNTQHYPTHDISVGASGHYGNLCTLILGDSSAGEDVGEVSIDGYQTLHLVANGLQESVTPLFTLSAPTGSNAHLVISGSGRLSLGDISSSAHEGKVSVVLDGGTITDVGVKLDLGVTDAETIDASNAPFLEMHPAFVGVEGSGVIVLGGYSDNLLQGSLGAVSTGFFTNNTPGVFLGIVGNDSITGGAGGSDLILGDGGADNIILPPNHSQPDSMGFGYDLLLPTGGHDVLAITNGADLALPGFWGADPRVQTTIPELFANSPTGGTSADMTTITGFRAGSGADRLIFDPAAWNGASLDGLGNPAASGCLLDLGGSVVASAGTAQLSAVWVNNLSNSALNLSDNVLRYAPGGGSPHNAQELAAQLHGASGAIVLPGFILPGQDEHILVAYDANSIGLPITENASAAPGFSNPLHGPPPVVHIADVDLVNTSAIPQSATFNLHVYASDMVSLTGVSLTSLIPDNIHFLL